jgi:two-component system, cell cycle sensor histidine kinase and response regulator CckA
MMEESKVDLGEQRRHGPQEYISLLKDNGDGAFGSVDILRDLSDESKMLDALKKNNERLEREIAARREVEISLRKSESAYRSIFENKGTASIILEEDATISLVNAEFEKLSGCTKKEVEGRKQWTEFVVEEDLERMKECHRLGRNDPDDAPRQYEFRFRNRFGEQRHVFLTENTIPGGSRTVASLLDITERKRLEEALARAEEKYRSIFENAIEGIFQTSCDGRLLSANPALARLLGYDSPEEMISTLTDISQQVYVNSERRAELLRLIEEWGSVQEFEAQFFRRDKSTAWVALNVRAVGDKNGKVAYLEGTVQDITDRKLLESQLLQAQKMEAIGTLAGGIAHDFNNILAAILGYTELTKGRLQQKELHGYLERVLQACDRAKKLVAQILTFSRQADQERKPLDARLLINETLKLLRAILPSTIEIRQKIASEVHAVLADPTQIHQVLINLCTNAAYAMRENGGSLEISLDNVELTEKITPFHSDLTPGPYVKLTVGDTGTGIEPEVIHRIFDPFFTTKRQGEGTGLGLSMVHGILSRYGGTVTVESEPGAGSIFSVYLPATGQDKEAKLGPPQAISKGSELVLFVDDEDTLMEMGRDMLENLGYQVTATTDSRKALEIFHSRPSQFDLVITDMTMPGMNGADLSKEILKSRPDIPIILCTGFSELITEEKAKRLGIREFLMKPLNMRSLAEIIRKVLGKKDS